MRKADLWLFVYCVEYPQQLLTQNLLNYIAKLNFVHFLKRRTFTAEAPFTFQAAHITFGGFPGATIASMTSLWWTRASLRDFWAVRFVGCFFLQEGNEPDWNINQNRCSAPARGFCFWFIRATSEWKITRANHPVQDGSPKCSASQG